MCEDYSERVDYCCQKKAFGSDQQRVRRGPWNRVMPLRRERESRAWTSKGCCGDLLAYGWIRQSRGMGYLPEQEILTVVGPVPVPIPKVRDRPSSGVVFRSSLVLPYVRKSRTVAASLPWRYRHGVSSGRMQAALSVLLGEEAKGLSPAVLGRLKAEWAQEHDRWQRQFLQGKRYAYGWADGVCTDLRLEDDPQNVSLGHPWRDGRRQEGGRGGHRRFTGLQSLLARDPAGLARPRATGGAPTGHRRWGDGFLGRPRRDLSANSPSALLGAQCRQ
uniref:Mutator family transposase n=1 Tax=Acidithiobacillus caldus TaxID=33059 RepID=A4ZV28_9PROT|nr:transposase [Acidithiobacillus caldus ATCC 51756]